MAKIKITRGRFWSAALRTYRISIDGVDAGEIHNGQAELFETTEGEHVVQCRQGWYKSQKFKVNVGADGVQLYCRPDPDFILGLWNPGEYIFLERGDGDRRNLSPEEKSARVTAGITNMVIIISLWAIAFFFGRGLFALYHINPIIGLLTMIALALISSYIGWRSRKRKQGATASVSG